MPSFPGWMNGDYDVNSAATGNFLMLSGIVFLHGWRVVLLGIDSGGQLEGNKKY